MQVLSPTTLMDDTYLAIAKQRLFRWGKPMQRHVLIPQATVNCAFPILNLHVVMYFSFARIPVSAQWVTGDVVVYGH